MDDDERQQIIDAEHLKMLRVGYIISGVLSLLFALFPLIYVVVGLFVAVAVPNEGRNDGPPPQAIGVLIAVIGLIASALIASSGILKLTAARAIGKRRSRTLCYIAAGLACLDVPLGTLLGVCSFIVLSRPTVIRLFDQAGPAQQIAPPHDYQPLFSSREGVDADRNP